MKKLRLQYNKKDKSGFTLVETLVAVSIFSVSILGLLVVLTQGVANTGYAKKKIIASYLAEEGVEYIRNLRDTRVLYSGNSQTGWDNFKTGLTNGSCVNSNGCYFNDSAVSFSSQNQPITALALSACTSATCANAPLLYNSSNWKYGYGSGVDSGFYRQIKASIINTNEVKITSTVYWAQNSRNYTITLSESLFNWAE